ncbi:MAG TPA: asparagine synthase-related protein [Leptolyngbyaceae cyanobacterium]
MSGIVGMINLDGEPVDRDLLQEMTEFMAYRGPDARQIWVAGNVGFGHALLATTDESRLERQPFSLDDRVWIAADVRIDSRRELIEKLQAKGCRSLEKATDVELILNAYDVWGEDCVKYLLGDFAFVIWDNRKQRLFCARDHFGVKPFYYALVENCLIFSNTLNCLKFHPKVSNQLNDLAIADFLLFDGNQQLDTTAFTDIHRLPPAYYLIATDKNLQLTRYWQLPVDGYIRYQQANDYVEHFQELMEIAVADRLRTDKAGVFMSGGLDSTTVAAVAGKICSEKYVNFDLRAYTIVYDKLIPDRERYYSGLVAEALGMPIDYLVADDYQLFDRWDKPEWYLPEPVNNPFLAILVDKFKEVANYSRVVLTGYGGDPVLYASASYFFDLLKSWQWESLARGIWQYLRSNSRLPAIGLRTQVKRWLGLARPWRPSYPEWLNGDLASRLDLRSRWEKLTSTSTPSHPIRSEAYDAMVASTWPSFFESYDPGVTGFPVEVRHPFFDLRLVNYLLAIPPIPWFVNKQLVRVAMRGSLPETVRQRPKAFLAGDPLVQILEGTQENWLNRWEFSPAMAEYINLDVLRSISERRTENSEVWINIRPLSLAYWLQQLETINC